MIDLMASAAAAANPNQTEQEHHDSLQSHFQPNVSAEEIEQVFHLKRGQPLLQVFTALFHAGFDVVRGRPLVLRELPAHTSSSVFPPPARPSLTRPGSRVSCPCRCP